MATVTASAASRGLLPLIAQVNEDHAEVRITSKRGNAVLIAEADFDAWRTTRHLFSTKANARHLIESLAQAAAGDIQTHELEQI
jgi:antitoxin YefM